MNTLKDFSVVNKRILVRCDFNVPINEKGDILDDFRIRKTLPTIKYLIEQKAKVILMSHLGDPGGKIVAELKMDKVAEKLSEFLHMPIGKEDDCVGPAIEGETNALEAGHVMLLENLRFHKEETPQNGSTTAGQVENEFAKKLSYLGDIYINDAFGACHRNNASITGVPQYSHSGAGLLLEKEIIALNKIMYRPDKPMVAIIGGTKVETKAKFIDSISELADCVIVSGLIKKEIQEKNIQFKHPEKILGPEHSLDALDIDKETIKMFCEKILQAKTIIWNGPFGKFEDKKYMAGTLAIANAIIESNAYSVVGGGETVEFLNKHGMVQKFSHVSTGGGAMLSYLSGDKLPGIEALK